MKISRPLPFASRACVSYSRFNRLCRPRLRPCVDSHSGSRAWRQGLGHDGGSGGVSELVRRMFHKRFYLSQHRNLPNVCVVEPSMQARAASPPFDRVSLPRPFVCEEEGCGKRFLQSGGLVRHRRTHTGEKPNVCGRPGCSERFACLNSAHVRPFACDYPGCSKCFAEPWNLVRHKRSHTGIYGAYKYTPPPEPSQYTLVNACLIANSATPAVPPYLPQSSKSAKNYNAIEDGLRLAQALFDSIDGAGLPDEQQPRLDRQPACTQSAPASRSSTKRVRDSDGDSVLRLAPDGDSVLQTIVPIRKRQAIREFDDWLKATAAVDGGS